ncbi:hypothetical protein [Paenibacillus planticolens]|uniref:DUF885 domain-containing protein n=1 Tax=Paenibacillus planticolens TaxID=2654976 RepID=A0ABX1ZL18_9BACL|nr:hypothetical protein [Paenibacillus planticolens]NOU99463.1 hypothetical protein [Paenibacillus planticolens]
MMKWDPVDLKLSESYAQIVLGMDQLYRSEKGDSKEASFDREGLVPINLTQEVARPYSDWRQVTDDLHDLGRQYAGIVSETRRNYMQQQIGSLLGLVDWCSGLQIPFREKVRRFLYVNENPVSVSERNHLHRKLDAALADNGYKGTLSEKVSAWLMARHVPNGEVESVLKELLAAGKERVVQTMFPQIEDVEVAPVLVYGVPYNAYCDYVNGKMNLNGSLSYTYEGLKHLVTHECYPGHTTHIRVRELGVQAGELPLDAALVITNTASSSVFEGIADNGIHFIDWAATKDDLCYKIYQQIRSIAGLNAAHMIHCENKPLEDVRDFLKQFAFGDDDWIATRLRFITHTLRAPFIYSYWRGQEAVADIYNRVSPTERSRFYQFLYTNMLSADTVKQFE